MLAYNYNISVILIKSIDNIKQFCLDKIMNIKSYSNKTKKPKMGFKI